MSIDYAVGVMDHTFNSAIGVVGEGKDLGSLVDNIKGLKSQALKILEKAHETAGKMIRISANDNQGNKIIVAHSPFMAEDSLIHPIIDASVHSLAGLVKQMPEAISRGYKEFDVRIYGLETANEVPFTRENYDLARDSVGVRVTAKLPFRDSNRNISQNYFFPGSGERLKASDAFYAALSEQIRLANHDNIVATVMSQEGRYDQGKIEEIERAVTMVPKPGQENFWRNLVESWHDNRRTEYDFRNGTITGPEIITSRYILIEDQLGIHQDRIGIVRQPYSVKIEEPKYVAFPFNGSTKPVQHIAHMQPIVAKPMQIGK